MAKIKHTLPIVAAAVALTAGSIIGPAFIQSASAAASEPTAAPTATPAPDNIFDGRPTAKSPAELLALLGERIKAKDVDGIIALQEPEAAIVNFDGSVIRGQAAIRAFYVEWFKSDPVLTVKPGQTVMAGGWRGWDGQGHDRTASIMGVYTLEQKAPDGTRQSFSGNFCDTVKEQWDGTWLYVQDNPYPPHGGAIPPAVASHH
ncbi:YybH family protein [Streptomyces sp. NPDC127112]|uniref:YybH family protein n=1 Tax=Streptomyces sp. NPDC127112 TaxID=3345364 RepID=UPI00363F248F